MEIKVSHKSSDLTEVLREYFGKTINLARLKFIDLFIRALCKLQTVCFEKLACGFDNEAQKDSSLRRIQRFIASYELPTKLIAQFIFALLPEKPSYTIVLDRTNWKLGKSNINILTLAVVYQGTAFPLLFKLMDKKGNSNTTERIEIIDLFISLFGKESIKYLLADREFVGKIWVKYLNDKQIEYHIRVRENFWIVNPKNTMKTKVFWLFNNLKINESRVLNQIYYVNGQLCYLSASRKKNKDGKAELQIIISYSKPDKAQKIYKERWQIETAFKALKSSGFNLEDTHLTDIDRLAKLLSLVSIAFTWAYLAGIFINQNLKPIRVLKTKRLAKSIFKYGLEFIAKYLLNPKYQNNINIYNFLSCT